MISKKLSLSALLIFSAAANISAQMSNDALVEAYKGKDAEWKYIEFLFIEKPKNKLNNYIQKVRSISLALVATTILATNFEKFKGYLYKSTKTESKETKSNKVYTFEKKDETYTFTAPTESGKDSSKESTNLFADLPLLFSIGGLGLIGFETITNYIDSSIKHDTLVNFIQNWEFHKKHVPTSLIPAFDELAIAFNASNTKTFTAEQVSSIFEAIQHLIEHEFSKRYEKDKKKDADMLGIVKTITDISKNLK